MSKTVSPTRRQFVEVWQTDDQADCLYLFPVFLKEKIEKEVFMWVKEEEGERERSAEFLSLGVNSVLGCVCV